MFGHRACSSPAHICDAREVQALLEHGARVQVVPLLGPGGRKTPCSLRRLVWTVNAWQPSIIEGLVTGISNGRTEGYNRIVKHIGRIALGFRNAAQTRNAGYALPAPAHHAGRQPEPRVPVNSEEPV